MNRLFLKIPIAVLICLFLFSACKKKNSLNDYPANHRIYNVVKKTTKGAVTVIDNYRFVYDRFNRIGEVYFTSNDASLANTISTFTYSNDTIYDTTKFINNQVIEVDTFITDRMGHITATYIMGVKTEYSYYDGLLTRVDYNPYSWETYTSFNNNITQAISSNTGYANATYSYYIDKVNRAGDYLALNSLVRYGLNFYNNRNLIDSFTEVTQAVKVEYTIDADSKITRTTARVWDTGMSAKTETYDLQYESF